MSPDMIDVVYFFLGLAVITWGLRTAALRYFRKHIQANDIISEPDIPDASDDDELVAVLSAAATTILKRPIILRKIRFLASPSGTAWSVTGRLNVMGSHLITKRKQ